MKIREAVAALLQPQKGKEKMAENTYEDHAAEAFALMAHAPTWDSALLMWRNRLQARIKSLKWAPVTAGVREQVIIKFPDESSLCLERFIRRDQDIVHTKLYRVQEEGK